MALYSGKLQPANAATVNVFSGQFAYQKKDYAKAIQRLEAAKAAGSTESNLPAMLLESYANGGQTDKGIAFAKAEIDRMMAAGQTPPDWMFVNTINALQQEIGRASCRERVCQ